MKLDSTIIGALIIGASLIIGAFVYTYNSDYKLCLRENQAAYERLGRVPDYAMTGALKQCKDIKN